MGDDETVFMDESIKTSYNPLHDETDVNLQQVALESQNHQATTLSGRNLGAQNGVSSTQVSRSTLVANADFSTLMATTLASCLLSHFRRPDPVVWIQWFFTVY